MPFCAECGTAVTAKFCGHCGAKSDVEVSQPVQQQNTENSVKEVFNHEETLATEQKRVAKAVDVSTSKASWDHPSTEPRKNYRPEMSPEEEMAFLRQRRKEMEDKLRREGKLK